MLKTVTLLHLQLRHEALDKQDSGSVYSHRMGVDPFITPQLFPPSKTETILDTRIVRIAGPLHLRTDLKHLRTARAYPNVRARTSRRTRASRFGNPTKPRILEHPFVGNSLLTRIEAKESASMPSPQRYLINGTALEIAGTTGTPEESSKVPLGSETPRAHLSSFAHHWTGAPPSIIKILSGGYHWICLTDPLPLTRHPQRTAASSELRQEVETLARKGAIYQVPFQPAYISPIFLVLKTSGGFRLIFDLSSLN